jgi:hypothetical protein
MEEKDILFSSITSSPAQSFFQHFGIMISEPLVLYGLAKPREKRMKKRDNKKRFNRTNLLKRRTAQILSSYILKSQILRSQILRS